VNFTKITRDKAGQPAY